MKGEELKKEVQEIANEYKNFEKEKEGEKKPIKVLTPEEEQLRKEAEKDKKDKYNNKDKKDKYNNKDKKDNILNIDISTQKQEEKGKDNLLSFVFFVRDVFLAKGQIGKIQLLLYEKDRRTLKQLSDELEAGVDSLRTTIDRNKDIIAEAGREGKEIVYSLTDLGNSQIEVEIQNYQKRQEYDKIIKEREDAKKRKTEELMQDIKKLIKNREVCQREVDFMYLDLEALKIYDLDLFERLRENPEEIKQIIEYALEENDSKLKLRFSNIKALQSIPIERLRAEHLNKLCLLECSVSDVGEIRPKITRAIFECPACGTEISVLQIEKKFTEPSRCSCGRRGRFNLIKKELIDYAPIVIEDIPGKSDNPYTKSINAFIEQELTSPEEIEKFTPGSDLIVLGVLIGSPVFSKTGAVLNRLDYEFKIFQADFFEPQINLSDFTEEETKTIKKISANFDKEGFKAFHKSYAPHIYGYEHIKNGLILQLAQPKNSPNKEDSDKSNILLIGDPGISKSKLLNEQQKLSQGAIKTAGGESTKAGLTYSIEKKEYGWAVIPGAFPRARDLLLIDEINSLSDEEKPKLQQGMSEREMPVNKASIHRIIKLTAGVTAAANPIEGKFNSDYPISRQFNLPLPIINRFDLIYTIKDIPGEADKEICKTQFDKEMGKIKREYPLDILKKFFIYAKNQPEPQFSISIRDKFSEYYMKSREGNNKDSVLLNPRFNDAVIRLSKASARIRLSKDVEAKDIQNAISVLRHTYKDTLNFEQEEQELLNALQILQNQIGNLMPIEEIYKVTPGTEKDVVDNLLIKLKEQGLIYKPKENYISIV